jgi:two-component system osmolarity sensor histidine kinase EnvZ
MFFQWLKQYVPRSLYARAALILIMPVVALQLLVTIVFIKRDLEDVTTQMAITVLREITLLRQQAGDTSDADLYLQRLAPYLAPLTMTARFVEQDAPRPQDELSWIEFSGRVVREKLQQELKGFVAVKFLETREFLLYLETPAGILELGLDRRRLTAAAPHQLIVTMVFFGFLMTVISIVYMRNQLRPIKKLADAAQAFGRGRNLPYSPRGATEVRVAGSAFLDMRARIERQIEQRTLMLSGVSHDLRTPLTRLKLSLAMIDEDEAEPMLRDVSEMQALLDAFLDF